MTLTRLDSEIYGIVCETRLSLTPQEIWARLTNDPEFLLVDLPKVKRSLDKQVMMGRLDTIQVFFKPKT